MLDLPLGAPAPSKQCATGWHRVLLPGAGRLPTSAQSSAEGSASDFQFTTKQSKKDLTARETTGIRKESVDSAPRTARMCRAPTRSRPADRVAAPASGKAPDLMGETVHAWSPGGCAGGGIRKGVAASLRLPLCTSPFGASRAVPRAPVRVSARPLHRLRPPRAAAPRTPPSSPVPRAARLRRSARSTAPAPLEFPRRTPQAP